MLKHIMVPTTRDERFGHRSIKGVGDLETASSCRYRFPASDAISQPAEPQSFLRYVCRPYR
jgi:hypothetical protein